MSSILTSAIRTLEAALTPPTTLTADYKAERNKNGQHFYIPYREEAFISQVSAALNLCAAKSPQQQLSACSFLDVGCGIGTKLILAASISSRIVPFGIEIDPLYADVAKKLLKAIENPSNDTNSYTGRSLVGEIIQGDALKQHYGGYDIIYFYCPLYDSQLQRKLEERIIKTASVGALILPNLLQHRELWKGPQVELLWESNNQIYRKVK